MNSIRFQSKEAFVEALEGRRAFWHAFDTKQAADHKAAEKKWLEDARAKMRAAIKMDYPTLRKHIGGKWATSLSLGEAPQCPVLMEAKIDRVLVSLRLTYSKSFTVDSQGSWSEAHNLLTWDPDAPTTVC